MPNNSIKFGIDLLPNVDKSDSTGGFNLGSQSLEWNIFGDLTGNATTATAANLETTTTNAIAYYTDTVGTFGSKASADGALYATSTNGTLTFGTLPVAQGGTGVKTIASGEVLIGNGTSAITTKAILNNTTVGALGWNSGGSTNANNLRLLDVNTLAYWNGAYSGTSSNIACVGTITTGIWNGSVIGTLYGGLGNSSFTQNRLLYSETATKFSSTSSIYASASSIAIGSTSAPANSGSFQVKGTSTLRDIYVEENNKYDIGTSGTRWKTAYLTASLLVGAASGITAYNSNALGSFVGPGVLSSCITTVGDGYGYFLMGGGQKYSRMYIRTIGGNGNGSTLGTLGETILELGNSIAQTKENNSGVNNSQGYLWIYGPGQNKGQLTYNNSMFESDKSLYFSNNRNDNTNNAMANEVRGIMGGSDYWRIAGGATAADSGYLEIATCSDGNEPIYIRQYMDTFTTLNTARTLTLLDASGNTSVPGNILPNVTNTQTIGNTTYKWLGVYAGTYYGSIESVADNASIDRHVWFARTNSSSELSGVLTHDDDFKYNPSTNVLTVGKLTITGGTTNSSIASAGTLTIGNGEKALTVSTTTAALTISTTNGNMTIGPTGTGTNTIKTNSGTLTISTTSGSISVSSGSSVSINSGSNYTIAFKINNVEYGRFNESGMFQLGSTSTQSSYKLLVNGGGMFSDVAFGSASSSSVTIYAHMMYNGTDQCIDFLFS